MLINQKKTSKRIQTKPNQKKTTKSRLFLFIKNMYFYKVPTTVSKEISE